MRLNTFLAKSGVCSRRRADTFIAQGDVRINGEIVTTLGTRVDPDTDRVTCQGVSVKLEQRVITIMLNKPVGVVSTCKSQANQRTVLDSVQVPYRLYPVGRLDKDSSGLLLLTNDGALALQLTHPRYHHEKEYLVTVRENIDLKTLNSLKNGSMIDDALRKPYRIRQTGPRTLRMTLVEGRKRQIRRMLQSVGHTVQTLKRIRVGSLMLGALPTGSWRELTPREITSLRTGT